MRNTPKLGKGLALEQVLVEDAWSDIMLYYVSHTNAKNDGFDSRIKAIPDVTKNDLIGEITLDPRPESPDQNT